MKKIETNNNLKLSVDEGVNGGKLKWVHSEVGSVVGHQSRPLASLIVPGIDNHQSALLDRLMKHMHAWVFDKPVDVMGLGLHDYHAIIKHPMDLGTVKSRLNTNWYKAPEDFAEDNIEADYLQELRIAADYEAGLPTPTSRIVARIYQQ
ncbi:hypothetical protein Nepgr_023699 [Nepenthes gracilis]|uniref:Bromo domain-containing protein n=1 Tax=Nepenthes gracilis TaxID=150966 RepID=A0AAD3XZP6_NEPGR|nr:hypothetical protein Nepgr_023699 [Nepenthes gracilis]